jgi:hypothetical protein
VTVRGADAAEESACWCGAEDRDGDGDCEREYGELMPQIQSGFPLIFTMRFAGREDKEGMRHRFVCASGYLWAPSLARSFARLQVSSVSFTSHDVPQIV